MSNPAPSESKGLGSPFRRCGKKGREIFFLEKKPRNSLISHDSDERIQGNPRKSNTKRRAFRSEKAIRQENPNGPRIYSDAVFAFVSVRWCLKSLIEANWNVPSPVSASIEPSEKIL
jgi:hypothetical protein